MGTFSAPQKISLKKGGFIRGRATLFRLVTAKLLTINPDCGWHSLTVILYYSYIRYVSSSLFCFFAIASLSIGEVWTAPFSESGSSANFPMVSIDKDNFQIGSLSSASVKNIDGIDMGQPYLLPKATDAVIDNKFYKVYEIGPVGWTPLYIKIVVSPGKSNSKKQDQHFFMLFFKQCVLVAGSLILFPLAIFILQQQ